MFPGPFLKSQNRAYIWINGVKIKKNVMCYWKQLNPRITRTRTRLMLIFSFSKCKEYLKLAFRKFYYILAKEKQVCILKQLFLSSFYELERSLFPIIGKNTCNKRVLEKQFKRMIYTISYLTILTKIP